METMSGPAEWMEEGTGKYNTPLDEVLPIARAIGGFDLDPCASADSRLARENIRGEGGLEADWYGKVWCNHPYARYQPEKWLPKAVESDTELVVTLSRGDPSTDYFHDYILQAEILCFPDERIEFVGEENDAKFPNVLAAFGDVPQALVEHFEERGWAPRP